MQKSHHYTPLAMTYSEALLELATETAGRDAQGQARAVGAELLELTEILDKEPSARVLLNDQAISEHERRDLIQRTFEGRVSPLLFKFLNVLNDKGRLSSLASIAGAYDDLLDKQLGKVEVDLTLALKLTAQSLEAVRQKIGAVMKRDVVLHQYLDEAILGGMVLRYQDKIIDGSVRTQLAQLREQIMSGSPK